MLRIDLKKNSCRMTNIENKHIILIVIVVFAALARLWGIGAITSFAGDEGLNVPAARNYCLTGHIVPDHWCHPPLKHLLLYGSMNLFGNNPYGWRMRNALFGILTVVMIFFLGKELFPDARVAVLAALFLAIDPLHIRLSMSTPEEIQAGFFFVSSVYFSIRYMKKSLLSGLFAGCLLGFAIATKWYYLPALVVLPAMVLFSRHAGGGLNYTAAVSAVSTFIVLPLAFYLITFYAWFGRGYDLMEFFQMQSDAYRALQSVSLTGYKTVLAEIASPLEWFTKPVLLAFQMLGEGTTSRFSVLMNNPPVWFLAWPAVVYLAYRAGKHKDLPALMVSMLFLITYGQFILVKRPIFLYSSMACLPFALLAGASLIVSVLDRLKAGARYYNIILAAVFAWGIYLYPFISGMPVPRLLYAPMLSAGAVYTPM